MQKYKLKCDQDREFILVYNIEPLVQTRDLSIDQTSYTYRPMKECLDRERFDWNLDDVYCWFMSENGNHYRSFEEVMAFIRLMRLTFLSLELIESTD